MEVPAVGAAAGVETAVLPEVVTEAEVLAIAKVAEVVEVVEVDLAVEGEMIEVEVDVADEVASIKKAEHLLL